MYVVTYETSSNTNLFLDRALSMDNVCNHRLFSFPSEVEMAKEQEYLLEHMSALLPFKFPASGKYAILNSFVTTTPIMHVQAAKALFDVIMHKVY